MDHESLRKEYELSQEMHNYYGRLTWQIAAIFLGGGITGLGVVVSTGRPILVLLFTIAFTVLVYSFYLFARRNGNLAEVHLARCRQIERILELRQHTYARQANEPRGVTIEGEPEPIIARHPTGWRVVKILCASLITIAWMIVVVLFVLHFWHILNVAYLL